MRILTRTAVGVLAVASASLGQTFVTTNPAGWETIDHLGTLDCFAMDLDGSRWRR